MATQIKFVGPESRLPYSDRLYGTKLVWTSKEQVHVVRDEVAASLLVHKDTWANAGHLDDAVATAIGLADVKPVVPEPELELPPLVQLEAMDKDALIEYAQRHFNMQPKGNVYQVRAAIRNLMNDAKHG
jgi:hypothetical protein